MCPPTPFDCSTHGGSYSGAFAQNIPTFQVLLWRFHCQGHGHLFLDGWCPGDQSLWGDSRWTPFLFGEGVSRDRCSWVFFWMKPSLFFFSQCLFISKVK